MGSPDGFHHDIELRAIRPRAGLGVAGAKHPTEVERPDADAVRAGRTVGCATEPTLERMELARARADVRPAAEGRGEVRSVRRTDDARRVGLVEHPQADSKVGVRPDVVVHRSRRALRREDQVDSEAPPPLREVDHAGHEIGDLLHQGRELVDDDHQAGRDAVGGHVGQLGEVLGVCSEQVHSTIELGPKAGQGAEAERFVEVRHRTHVVWQSIEGCREGATLVVDEQEVQPLGWMGCGQGRDPRLEELGLPCAGGSCDQRMGALLNQIEHVGALAADAHRRREPNGGASPALGHRLGVGTASGQHVVQRHHAGKRRDLAGRRRVTERRHMPSEGERTRRRPSGRVRSRWRVGRCHDE